jgi:DNA-binding CsgD family transcriptional regulator
MLDSDLEADPGLYLDAAQHTMRMLDLDLAERFASAAAELDPAGAAKVRAINMVLKGQGQQAEDFLRSMTSTDDAERRQWALIRAANMIWMLGRPKEASPILAELVSDDESDADKAARLALEACVDVVAARCEIAEEKARAAMESGTLSDFNAIMASVALVMASGGLGHTDDLIAVANAAIERATDSFETAHLRFWFGGVYLRACRLTGRIDEARRASAMMAVLAKDAPGLPHANLMFLMGQAELMRGELRSAVRLLHESLAAAEHHGAATLRPACSFALVEAHSKLGEAEAAAEMLVVARDSVKPDYLFMQTALAVSTGWSLAAAGLLHDAITTVMDEAKVARDRDQPTHEVACLQAAIQWGIEDGLDKVAVRARELAERLALPIADIVATHAESLLAKDGEALMKVSSAYAAMGDRCTAADAANQAGVAFAAAQLRSRATNAASVAQQLAADVGGLCTPATRIPVATTPLTGRQREVAELVAVGLSNKEIADRLVTSVRTVEGHLYRACQRVGARSRSELAAIMRAGSVGSEFDTGDDG